MADDHTVVLFGTTAVDPVTGAASPDIRMVRLYLRGKRGYLRAFLERRYYPALGFTDWAIVCPNSSVSATEVATVWKARGIVSDDAVQIGRPPGPSSGSDIEAWVRRGLEIGERAALAEYKALTPQGQGQWQARYQRWYRNVRPRLQKPI